MSLTSPNPALAHHNHTRLVSLNAPARLDATSTLVLKASVRTSLADGPALVLLDLSALSSIEASGVAGLLEMLHEVRSRGGDLRLHGSSAPLGMSRLQAHLGAVTTIYEDHEKAINGGSRTALHGLPLGNRNTTGARLLLKFPALHWMRHLMRS